jgi:hypothetical protein
MSQSAAEADTESSTMRTPKDVIRMIGVLAKMDNKSITDFNDTDLREWVTKKYKARIAKEGKGFDLGEAGA